MLTRNSSRQAPVEEHLRAQGFDAVVESALADEDEFRAVSAAYRQSGHRIEVVVVATAEALAQSGVLERSLADGFRYGAGRAGSPSACRPGAAVA